MGAPGRCATRIGNLGGPRLGPGPAFATGSEAPSALGASRSRGMARAAWAGIALPSKRQGAKHTLPLAAGEHSGPLRLPHA